MSEQKLTRFETNIHGVTSDAQRPVVARFETDRRGATTDRAAR
jgi:hypothetical protein